MSDEIPIGPDEAGDNAIKPTPADYFTMQVAADNSCAIKFFADGVQIGWFYMPSDLADVLWANLDPEQRKAKLDNARADFHKKRH